MKTMRPVANVVVPLLATLQSLALTAPAEVPAETVGVFLLRVQEESAAPMIQHCAARIPEQKKPLETEYAKFKKRFRKATAPLRAKIGRNSELSITASRELIQQFEGMDRESLVRIRKLDPHVFCPQLKANLSDATAESIRKNMENTFARYTAAARRSRP
ncbi:MAG: hypothetical protein ABI616_11695 [Pseudomonadota bacterium]